MEDLKKIILEELNSKIADYKENVDSYGEKIKNPKKFFNELSTWGGTSARAPIRKRAKINFLLNYTKTNQITTPQYMKEQEEQLKLLDKAFEKIKQKKDYQEKLFQELSDSVVAYERAIKYIKIMFSNSDEFTNDLDGRDICEILLKELKGKKGVSEFKKRVEKTDNELKKHAPKLLKIFYGYYEDGGWDYYPKSYWWRHLKEFVKEKGEKS
ncbi:MAG: hypothetical protein ABH986_04940 [archaeon]